MAKIIGNTTATPNPRPDWNQTDETKADYIKNKPTDLATGQDVTNTLAEAKSYTDTKTAGLASTSTLNTSINTHNTSTSAHNDIRALITDLTTKLNNFLDVDDTTTDQLSEIITLIENNKGTLESLTTSKINVSDIVNDLTTNSTSKVLSAAQGVAIKTLIDSLQSELDSHTHAIADVSGLQSALDGKAASSHGTHVSYSTTAPVMDGTASVGTASTVARSDHKHPTDTSRAAQTSLDSHTSNKSNPHSVTLAQLGVTATAAEINKLDGVTATTAELNILDGVTATTTELNYVDGVTSNIQTQLNGKAASSHGTHVSYSTTAPVMDGTASVGTASTVARSDHRHPTDTSRASKTELDTHTSNKSNPHDVTKAQIGLGNVDNTADANKTVASASKLTTARNINGVAFDGTSDIAVYSANELPRFAKLLKTNQWYRIATITEAHGFSCTLQFTSSYDYTIPQSTTLAINARYDTNCSIVQLSNTDVSVISKVRAVRKIGAEWYIEIYYTGDTRGNPIQVVFSNIASYGEHPNTIITKVDFTDGTIPDGYTATEFELSSNPVKATTFEGDLVGVATKAISDENGNNIVATYATKDEIANAGTGDMLRSVYDTNNNGVVDNAEKLGGIAASSYALKSDISYPVAIAKGGTGATTAEQARTNLGIPNIQVSKSGYELSNSGNYVSINCGFCPDVVFFNFHTMGDEPTEAHHMWHCAGGAFGNIDNALLRTTSTGFEILDDDYAWSSYTDGSIFDYTAVKFG